MSVALVASEGEIIMADITKEDVIEWLSNQSVLEIAGLVKDLEESGIWEEN